MTAISASDPAPEQPAPAAKVDPETLVLRARPGRVVRFKRSVVVLASAIAVAAVAAAAWFALKPRTFELVSHRDSASEPTRPPADALGDLPASYADAPRLGPPLPGDLGRAIVEHERALAAEEASGDAAQIGLSERERAAEAERERIAALARSARESSVLVSMNTRTVLPPVTPVAEPADVAPSSARPSLDPERDPNAQGRKAEFVAALDRRGEINPHRVLPPPSRHVLSAGHVIPASLITGLRSDLPGLVIAQVTERVYDSPSGRVLLIPQGARLIGTYDSVVAFGQSRALIVWQRLVFPDGRSLTIDNVPATDAAGYAGLADKVDFHTWSLLKGVAISTLLGVGSNLTFSGESDLVRAVRESTQQNASRAGDQITSRNLGIQPTITIRPGAPVRLIVHRDLILEPWNR